MCYVFICVCVFCCGGGMGRFWAVIAAQPKGRKRSRQSDPHDTCIYISSAQSETIMHAPPAPWAFSISV